MAAFGRVIHSDELETDEYAARHTRQLFFNQVRPDFRLTGLTRWGRFLARVEFFCSIFFRG